MIAGTLEYFENTMNTIKNMANKEANKDADTFKIILLTYPKVMEHSIPSKKGQRSPLTGTIDEIGTDVKRIKDMGVEHIIFGYSFLPTGGDVGNMIDITKQLSKFCS